MTVAWPAISIILGTGSGADLETISWVPGKIPTTNQILHPQLTLLSSVPSTKGSVCLADYFLFIQSQNLQVFEIPVISTVTMPWQKRGLRNSLKKQRKRTWSGEGGDASFANIPSFVIDFGYYRITNSPSPAGFPLMLPKSLKQKERQGLSREIMEKCRFSVNPAFSEYILCFNPLLCFCSLISSKFTFLFLKLQSPPKL